MIELLLSKKEKLDSFVELIRKLVRDGLIRKPGKVCVESVAICLVLNLGHKSQWLLDVVVLDKLDNEGRIPDRASFRVGCRKNKRH